ncbi:MAG: MFS transporter [Desulfobacteraceae bacterium]|nr:MFS transporter [Desulfobacteraceae bacterium]
MILISFADKKVFAILFFSLFATITGVGIVVPLLPVYAHDLGAAGLYIGLIFGAFSLSRTFFLPYFGRLSDRKGRKPLILYGLLAYTLVSVTFVISSSVIHLIVIRFFQGIASAMIMPVVQAYVGDITPSGKEGTTMGLFNMSLFFGLSIGPVAGGVLNDNFGLNATFICMGVLSLAGFFLCVLFLPPTASEAAVRKGQPPVKWTVIIGDPVISGLFVFRLAYTASIGIIWGFLPVLADLQFGLDSSQIGVLVMLGVLISGAIQFPMGCAADRWNCKVLVIAGGVVSAAAIYTYYWARTPADLYIASIIFGLGGGMSMPALMAVAVRKGHKTNSMGSVIAILTMSHSLGMLLGSLFAGLMMDWFELRDSFRMGAVIMIIGVAVFYACVRGVDVSSKD